MGQEIERKYLVKSDTWRAAVSASTHIVQGYLPTGPEVTVRVRIAGDRAYLTIKGQTEGIARAEFEYPIPVEDAQAMLTTLAKPGVIDKVRHLVPHAGRVWEVDVFAGENLGLIMAEVELQSADSRVELPEWAGTEVSGDARFYNSELSRNPFSNW